MHSRASSSWISITASYPDCPMSTLVSVATRRRGIFLSLGGFPRPQTSCLATHKRRSDGVARVWPGS